MKNRISITEAYDVALTDDRRLNAYLGSRKSRYADIPLYDTKGRGPVRIYRDNKSSNFSSQLSTTRKIPARVRAQMARI